MERSRNNRDWLLSTGSDMIRSSEQDERLLLVISHQIGFRAANKQPFVRMSAGARRTNKGSHKLPSISVDLAINTCIQGWRATASSTPESDFHPRNKTIQIAHRFPVRGSISELKSICRVSGGVQSSRLDNTVQIQEAGKTHGLDHKWLPSWLGRALTNGFLFLIYCSTL